MRIMNRTNRYTMCIMNRCTISKYIMNRCIMHLHTMNRCITHLCMHLYTMLLSLLCIIQAPRTLKLMPP